jgi:hypothetical protein
MKICDIHETPLTGDGLCFYCAHPEEQPPESCPKCHGEGYIPRSPKGWCLSDDLPEYDPCPVCQTPKQERNK